MRFLPTVEQCSTCRYQDPLKLFRQAFRGFVKHGSERDACTLTGPPSFANSTSTTPYGVHPTDPVMVHAVHNLGVVYCCTMLDQGHVLMVAMWK